MTFRVRGVVELEGYRAPGDTDSARPFWYQVRNLSAPPPSDGWNVYKLDVVSQTGALSQRYYLNAASPAFPRNAWCQALDYSVTARIAGGDTLRLSGDSVDAGLLKNKDQAGGPLTTEIGPKENGQFVQVDVIGIKRVAK